MSFNFFLQGIKNIVFNPVKFWETLKSEQTPSATVRNSFLIPLAFLVTLSAFFGSLFFTNSELSPAYSALTGLKCFAVILIAVYSTAYLVGEITNVLDLGRNFNFSFNLVVFSVTPFLMCQILSRLFESLLFVNIIAFYGLYIFWVGVEMIMNPPQYKKMPLLIAVFITFTGIFIATNLMLSMIIDKVYYLFFA